MISLTSILKASQALSSELALETLLVKIMRIVIENAAAQTGYLILRSQHDETWRIEASGTIASDEVQVLQSVPLETVTSSSETPLLSTAIANYVIRTQTSVVLHDAAHEGEFTRDPYILQQQPKSLLCMPLSVQDKLVGIFYLENNLATGVFTPARLDVLNLLSSQAAISIENAKLYAQLRESKRKSIQINAFQDITERKQTEKLLADYNRTLEAQVTQRTAQLTQANQQLEREISDVYRQATQRQQAQEALRESESRFRAVFEQAAVGMGLCTVEGQFFRVNQKLCDIIGYTHAEMLERTFQDITPVKDRPQMRQSVQQLLAGEIENYSLENRYICKDGSVVWVNVVVSLMREPTGEPQYFIYIAEDISDRKRAEQALKKSEHALAEAQRLAHLGNWSYDLLTREMTWSDEVFRIYGLDPDRDEPTEQQHLQQFHPDDREQLQRSVQLAITQGQPYEHEIRIFLPNGSMRYTLGRGQPVFDETGRVVQLFGTVQDITQRKQAEEELRESEAKFRQLAENIREVFFILDKSGQILYTSPAYEQVWGQTRESLYQNPRSWLESVHPEEQPQIAAALDRQIHYIVEFDETYRIVKSDGEIRWIRARSFPVEYQNFYRFVGIAEDITVSKQAEETLQQAKLAAEAANQAKSAFLANMSHELRTPLNAILGFSQLMYKSSNLPLEHKKNLGTIIRSGEHLLALINQVLDLSKIEAGRTTLNETDFNLYRLLDDLQDLFQLKANHQGLQLDFERSPDVPQYIRTDEVKLRQVLINLLSNAMKFTSSGGVSLRVSKEVGNRQENTNFQFPSGALPTREMNSRVQRHPIPNSQLHFEVEDTGSGIAAEEIDCIFDAFVQTKTGQQFQEGTGLGLTISRKFVELMGGEISVNSQVGRGTTFTFDIRVQLIETPELEHQQPTRRAIALEPNQPRYRILIVDDIVNNRQVLSELLSPFGLELEEASNGLEAIAIWEAWQPHLILMDMRMPVMDGYEATQRIKSLTKSQATTIIAVTASSLEEERATILSAGCDDFIRKPFKEQEICDVLHKYIGVRFVYDEPAAIPIATETKPDTLIPSALATLPVDLVADFHQSLMELDVEQIQSFIERIRELNEPLANALAAFTNNFQYEKLLNLIQSSRG